VSFLKTIFKFVNKEVDYAARFEKYAQMIYPCEKCKSEIDISETPGLSMVNCPECNDLFLVPKRLDDWWVITPIGSGGMGAVYMGRSIENPDLTSAVKVLQVSEQVNQVFLDLLVEEGRVASLFGQHPHLAQVYNYGFSGPEAYMIMEFIQGTRFDKLVENSKHGLNEEMTMYYLLDMLTGLEHIFNCGYLYRDLKPENIILREDNGLVGLVDYGLCMTVDEAWNNDSDDIMGSPLYMPPERIRGEGEDFRADFYALGMVVFYMMNGEPYFSQTELMKVVQRQSDSLRLQTKTKMGKNHHPLVIAVVDKLIRVDRDERFMSYHEIRYAVHEAIIELCQKGDSCPKTMARRAQYIAACQSS
jgi:eukaryotic-like serine/threonine-protein kinase